MESDTETDADVLKLADVCRIVGLSRPTVRKWITSGELPAVQRGRCWTVRRGDLDAMLRSMES
jgi:excisionase family DNA binding protein